MLHNIKIPCAYATTKQCILIINQYFSDTQLFQSVLLSMMNLKHLLIKNIANDNILKTIGQSCSQLETLDISHSSQVTDNGIKQLLIQVEIKDKSNNDRRKAPSTARMSWWHAIKTLSR